MLITKYYYDLYFKCNPQVSKNCMFLRNLLKTTLQTKGMISDYGPQGFTDNPSAAKPILLVELCQPTCEFQNNRFFFFSADLTV